MGKLFLSIITLRIKYCNDTKKRALWSNSKILNMQKRKFTTNNAPRTAIGHRLVNVAKTVEAAYYSLLN